MALDGNKWALSLALRLYTPHGATWWARSPFFRLIKHFLAAEAGQTQGSSEQAPPSCACGIESLNHSYHRIRSPASSCCSKPSISVTGSPRYVSDLIRYLPSKPEIAAILQSLEEALSGGNGSHAIWSFWSFNLSGELWGQIRFSWWSHMGASGGWQADGRSHTPPYSISWITREIGADKITYTFGGYRGGPAGCAAG